MSSHPGPERPTTPPAPAADDAARPRVVVLFGGRSGEHAISCATAAGVLRALDRDRYDVTPVGITPDGRWVLVDDDPAALEIRGDVLPQVDGAGAEVVVPLAVGDRALRVLEPLEPPRVLGDVDVVFPVLHGPFGEDGTLQGMLELADVRYVGAGVLASAVGMDKHYMKIVLEGQGIPVAPWTVVRPGQWAHDPAEVLARVEPLGLPLFVKPARAGSSLGISRVDDLADLGAAIDAAREHDPKVLVEAGLAGREIECAVLEGRDGAPPRTSVPGEIVVTDADHGFYDFASKYLGQGGVELRSPADLPADVARRVQEVAAATFEAVGAEGLSRVDVFVLPDGGVVVNEINTMPGFTPFSMYPRLWAASGVGYPELVDELVQLALRRPTGLR